MIVPIEMAMKVRLVNPKPTVGGPKPSRPGQVLTKMLDLLTFPSIPASTPITEDYGKGFVEKECNTI